MQIFVRVGNWKKKSQKIDLNSCVSNWAAETEKKKPPVVKVFYKKIAFFPQMFYRLSKSEKKLENVKKWDK